MHLPRHLELHSLCTWLIASLLTLMVGLPANGQGTEGVFPEPLDWQACHELLEPLSLTPEQFQAIEGAHQEYLESMMSLRDGPIKEFVEGESFKSVGTEYSQEEHEERLSTYRKLARQLGSIETNFLDSLTPVLGPNQAARLPIVRDWRERQRIFQTPWPWNTWSPGLKELEIEVRSMIELEEYEEPTRTAVEEALIAYESQQTRFARQLFDQRLKGRIRELEIEAELGPIEFHFDENGAKNEEGIRAWRNEQLVRHHDAYGSAIKTMTKLRSSRDDALFQIIALLPDRPGRDLRWDAWTRLYGTKDTFQIRSSIVNLIHNPEHCAHLGISDASVLEDLLASHDGRIWPHMKELKRLTDKDTAERGATFFYYTEEDTSSPQSIERTAIHDETHHTARMLQSILGEKTPPHLNDYLAGIDGNEDALGDPDGDDAVITEAGDDDDSVFANNGPSDQEMALLGKIADPISPEDLRWLVLDLDAGENGEAIVDVLYQTYSQESASIHEQFRTQQRKQLIRLEGEYKSGYSMDEFETMQRDFGDLQKGANAQMKKIDDQFFDDLVLAVENVEGQEVLHWHRLARHREYAQSSGGLMSNSMKMVYGPGNQNWTVDLMRMLANLDLTPEERRNALKAMRDWHETTTNRLVLIADLDLKQGKIMTQMVMSQQQEAERDLEATMKIVDQIQDLAQQKDDSRDQQQEHNTQTLAAIVEVLPPDHGARLQRLVQIDSYPAVYDDPHSIREPLLKSMQLEELDEQTRAAILELQTTYDQQYEMYCDQLVELFSQMAPQGLFSVSLKLMEEREKINRELKRVRFERDDYSDKARDRLRNLLTSEQVETIGGLETPTSTTMYWPKI